MSVSSSRRNLVTFDRVSRLSLEGSLDARHDPIAQAAALRSLQCTSSHSTSHSPSVVRASIPLGVGASETDPCPWTELSVQRVNNPCSPFLLPSQQLRVVDSLLTEDECIAIVER